MTAVPSSFTVDNNETSTIIVVDEPPSKLLSSSCTQTEIKEQSPMRLKSQNASSDNNISIDNNNNNNNDNTDKNADDKADIDMISNVENISIAENSSTNAHSKDAVVAVKQHGNGTDTDTDKDNDIQIITTNSDTISNTISNIDHKSECQPKSIESEAESNTNTNTETNTNPNINTNTNADASANHSVDSAATKQPKTNTKQTAKKHKKKNKNKKHKKHSKKGKKAKLPANYRRVQSELRQILLNPPIGISAAPINKKNILEWIATVMGPAGTPYANGKFYLNIKFGERYPFDAPSVRFKTRIYHCNVNWNSGEICLDVLKDQYSPALTVEKILLSIIALLQEPNPEDPLVADIANRFISDRKAHDETAKEWTQLYAMAHLAAQSQQQ